MKLIAEVAIPISFALDACFDYSIPAGLEPTVSRGCRVIVPFRKRRHLGYVVRLKRKSAFERWLRPISKNLDAEPILDEPLFDLAKFLQTEYFCSFAEAIHALVPAGLKTTKILSTEKGREAVPAPPFAPLTLTDEEDSIFDAKEWAGQKIVLHDPSGKKRWKIYAALIKKNLNEGKSALFLVPDHRKIQPALQRLQIGTEPFVLTSRMSLKKSADTWLNLKQVQKSFVIGTRSAIFSPVQNLGLIIVDEEDHFAYKQEQVPYYDTRKVAFKRASEGRAKVVLGALLPSLETWFDAQKGGVSLLTLPREESPACVQFLDTAAGAPRRLRHLISRNLEYRLAQSLERKEAILLFSSRKGFSTFLFCRKCNAIKSCTRCSASLVYFFKEKAVICPTCQYKTPSFDVCPTCLSSYVRYLGFGAEKVESEILRLFPSVKLSAFDPLLSFKPPYDIAIATPEFLESPEWNKETFDTVCVLDADRMFGYPDFRATEQAFSRLFRLLLLAKKDLMVQTGMPDYYPLLHLRKGDVGSFFTDELGRREELNLPPIVKMAAFFVRSKQETKAQETAGGVYKKLKRALKNKKDIVRLLEPSPAIPLKKRGSYHYQVLLKYRTIGNARKIFSSVLKNKYSGAIVTVDPSL